MPNWAFSSLKFEGPEHEVRAFQEFWYAPLFFKDEMLGSDDKAVKYLKSKLSGYPAEMVKKIISTYVKNNYDPTSISEALPFLDLVIPMPPELSKVTLGSVFTYSMAIYNYEKENNPKDILDILGYKWVQDEGIKTPEELVKYLKEKGFYDKKMVKTALSNVRKYGFSNWYDWRLHYWGTKWDVGDFTWPNHYTVEFSTAWAAPLPIFYMIGKMFSELIMVIEIEVEGFNLVENIEIIKGKLYRGLYF